MIKLAHVLWRPYVDEKLVYVLNNCVLGIS